MLLFAPLVGETSLFQQGVQRLTGAEFSPPVIVTSADFRFIVTEQLAAAGVDPGAILIEPAARNTGPSVLVAALYLANTDAESLILVAPSDHLVPGSADFRAAVLREVAAARAGQIVAFGIHPTCPETGYGNLELAGPRQGDIAQPLARFVEKPDLALAQAFLAGGRHLWNAGIFLFTARTLIGAVRAHAPELMAPVGAALDRRPGHGTGDGRWRGPSVGREPVGLCAPWGGAPAVKSTSSSHGPDRSAERVLSGRG